MVYNKGVKIEKGNQMSTMNQFDFYQVTVKSPRKSDLKKMGLSENRISSRRSGWKTYGRNSYPIYEYIAYVGFTEANESPEEIELEWKKKCVGSARVHVEYVARD